MSVMFSIFLSLIHPYQMIIGELILKGYFHVTIHATGFKQRPRFEVGFCLQNYNYMHHLNVVTGNMVFYHDYGPFLINTCLDRCITHV